MTEPTIHITLTTSRPVTCVQCAKCGLTTAAYVIAPPGSIYAGLAICVTCLDAPRRRAWGPQEFKER